MACGSKKKMALGGTTGDPLGGSCGKKGCKTNTPPKSKSGSSFFQRMGSGSGFTKKKHKWV